MPRGARLVDAPLALHHVVSRGIQRCFESRGDVARTVSTLPFEVNGSLQRPRRSFLHLPSLGSVQFVNESHKSVRPTLVRAATEILNRQWICRLRRAHQGRAEMPPRLIHARHLRSRRSVLAGRFRTDSLGFRQGEVKGRPLPFTAFHPNRSAHLLQRQLAEG